VKIGIVSSESHPMNAAAAARSGSWASLFVEMGHEVTVFSSCEAHSEKRNLVRSWFRAPDNRASVAKRLLQEVCLGVDLAFRIMLKARKTEVNLITSPPFVMAAFCAFACRLAGIPYVFDVRDRYPNVLFELKVLSRDGLPGRMLLGLEKVICNSSFFVSTVTKGLLADLRGIAHGRDPFLSFNGFADKAFHDQLLSRPQFPRFTVVYHGRLGRFYDMDALCEVIEIVEEMEPKIRFLMIGDLSVFRARKPWKTVEFMDEMPLEKLAPVLARCHVGICLLKETDAMRKALPAKTFDFMGAGLPMVVSPGGELLELVAKEGMGIGFHKNDAPKIAQAIVDLHQEKDQLETLRANALIARTRYGRDKQAKCLLEKITRETIF